MDAFKHKINVTEMHCGGGPIRIVNCSELPPILGDTLLEKRAYFKEHLDHLRRFILYEPRGHADLYGIIIVEPDTSEAVAGLILVHNEGYGSMCGHGALSLARYAVDYGLVKEPVSPETKVTFQFPCGLIDVFVEIKDGKSSWSRFRSVPSYVPDKGKILNSSMEVRCLESKQARDVETNPNNVVSTSMRRHGVALTCLQRWFKAV